MRLLCLNETNVSSDEILFNPDVQSAGSLNEGYYANIALNGSSGQTPSMPSRVQTRRASSPKQARRGSAGPGELIRQGKTLDLQFPMGINQPKCKEKAALILVAD